MCSMDCKGYIYWQTTILINKFGFVHLYAQPVQELQRACKPGRNL